jgi:hypothetical protein
MEEMGKGGPHMGYEILGDAIGYRLIDKNSPTIALLVS